MPPSFHLTYQSEERVNCPPWNWYTLDDFLEGGFADAPDRAQAWFDADVSPEQALDYEKLGLTPAGAWDWGMVPQAVESYMDGGFDRDEAWAWADHMIFGHEAMFWRHGGFTPTDADRLRRAWEPEDPALAVLWALTGLSAEDALDHALHGANPADFLSPPEQDGAPLGHSPGAEKPDDHDEHDPSAICLDWRCY